MRAADRELTTEGLWLGGERPRSFGWLSHRADAVDRSAVLILPPLGYAWWSAYATLRALAEDAAATGHTALRLHYHGTGDAPGTQWEEDQWAAWRDSIGDGARVLRELGCTELTLVGAGLGATFALQLADELGAAAVVAWAPIVSGRRESRALGLRSMRTPDGEHVSQAGTVIAAATLAEISALDLLAGTAHPARALILDGPAAEPLAETLRAGGTSVVHREAPDGEQALTAAAEDAVVARGLVATVAEWLGSGDAGHAPPPRLGGEAVLSWGTGRVRELPESIGRGRLRGIRCEPVDVATAGTVVLLSSGSEPHVGPGRAWVELARDLAVGGLRSLRVDFRGWGESPDDGLAPGRPYDAHGIDDTLDVVAALEARGDGPVVLVGLCAGAWTALRAILQRPIAGVVALNPQLYWQPGDPVEALLTDTRRRRAGERAEEEAGRASGRWDALDRAGERNWAGTWLDALATGTTDVSMLFADGDDGLEYLDNRLALRLEAARASGRVHVREVAEIDHAMQRAWLRPRMFAAIREAAERGLAATGTPAPGRR